MDASKKQREPVAFKSLAELKRFIRPGVEFKTVSHANHADMVGLTRVVTKMCIRDSGKSIIAPETKSKLLEEQSWRWYPWPTKITTPGEHPEALPYAVPAKRIICRISPV